MHDAHAAVIVSAALGKEGGDLPARLIAVQAVQVEVILHYPAAATQIFEYLGCHARFEEHRFVAAFELQLKQVDVGERFAQSGTLVALALARNWWRWGWFVVDVIDRQRHGIGDRRLEQGARCGIERPGRHVTDCRETSRRRARPGNRSQPR